MSSPTFHPFPRLPTEIQLQIWGVACISSTISRDAYNEQPCLHYVNVDTYKTKERDQLNIRAIDNQRAPLFDGQNPINNRSAYMWDGGLWMAFKQSHEVTTKQSYPIWARLRKNEYYPGRPAILATRDARDPHKYMVFPRLDIFCIRTADWKSLPHHVACCKTGLPSFDPLSSSVVTVDRLAIEFDSSWIIDFPETLEELKGENSARGLVTTWIEGVDIRPVSPGLFLIDKGTILVQKTGTWRPVYHDCDGMYTQMHLRRYNDAIDKFIEAFWSLLSTEKYGDLYAHDNPDSHDEELRPTHPRENQCSRSLRVRKSQGSQLDRCLQ
ncbi:uncharacterized protein BKA55DRAFT_544194 [Fusarium redolens]|uniref:2EXR domain-containing protein n=1 Tax=Fusarium redolens TaxID=48865 RepID=A0A9P9GAG6_FUSRE|nr:uncharacterized protein BKA55DRAFT_544194 [Fusarium redolens]KAH7235010.1 hypothetical protein BKA55DRAFT_544194 [Fusarium redolens]